MKNIVAILTFMSVIMTAQEISSTMTPHNIDQNCMSQCVASGRQYGACQAACSYLVDCSEM